MPSNNNVLEGYKPPDQPSAADIVREELDKLGIGEKDIAEAIAWSRDRGGRRPG